MKIRERFDVDSSANLHPTGTCERADSRAACAVLKLQSKKNIGTELFEVQDALSEITGAPRISMCSGSRTLPGHLSGVSSPRGVLATVDQAERPKLLELDPESVTLESTAWTLPPATATAGVPVPAANSIVIQQILRDEERRDRDVQELLLVDWDNEFIPNRYVETAPEVPQTVKKPRVSRKGKQSGPHCPIIEEEWFGPLQVIERIRNDGRHRCVSIFCSLCGEKGECRFGELRDGTVKSCGCLERAADRSFQASIDDWVRHLETRQRKTIFRQIVTLGTAKTIELRGLSKRQCDTLWRYERDRLAKIPVGNLTAICQMAKSDTAFAVARRYKLEIAEVLHIMQAADLAKKRSAKTQHAVWDELDETSRAKAQRTLSAAGAQIDEALENAEIKEWSEGSKGRRFGELSQAEFCSGQRYSYFAWVYAAASLMPEAVAQALFGNRVTRFISLVQHTVASRAERQSAYLKSRDGRKPVRTASKVRWARRTDGYYDPCQDASITAERMTLIGSIDGSTKSNATKLVTWAST